MVTRNINIFIDGSIFSLQSVGGITKYWLNILRYYLKSAKVNKIMLRLYKGNDINFLLKEFLDTFSNNPKLFISISKYPPAHNFNYNNWFYTLQRNIEVLVSCFESRTFFFDIFHSTYYSLPEFTCFIKKVYITYYDMIHEHRLSKIEGRKSAHEIIKLKDKAVKKSNCLICISNSTRKNMLSHYNGINPDRTKVIWLGVDKVFKNSFDYTDDIKKKYRINFDYFIYIGNRNFYKNFDILLKSYLRFIKQYPTVKLLLIGGEKDFKNEQRVIIDTLNNKDKKIILLNNITDTELAAFYNLSIGFISTSLEEGFGMQILEAMAANTNLILSDINVYREIAEDYALYFSPHNPNGLVRAMKIVYKSDKCSVNAHCKDHLLKFTWENCAEQTLNFYFKSLG